MKDAKGLWPIVETFAHAMRRELDKNKHKGGRENWLKDDPEDLSVRIREELDEMDRLASNGVGAPAVAEKAVDVANMAMMTWDSLLRYEIIDRTVTIPMILTCPACAERHIDKGKFATKVHHTHSCQACGLTWRPAVVPTVGVQFLPGFKDEP